MRTKKTIAVLQARIDQLEAQAASGHEEPRSSRRNMLRLAGAAAVGGLAAAVTSQSAAATDGAAVLAGVSGNTATLPTGIAVTAAGGAAYGVACYEAGLGALSSDLGRPAVFGHAIGSAFTKGVAGHSTVAGGTGVYGLDDGPDFEGTGVLGKSANGYPIYGEGTIRGVAGRTPDAFGALALANIGVLGEGDGGALRLDPKVPQSPPIRKTMYTTCVLDTDAGGNVWYCYEGGVPGKWRKLAGPASAGTFHAITPTRVYDSRSPLPTPGTLVSGDDRLVSVADARDPNGGVTVHDVVPEGATAVAANFTVTGTTGAGGYLVANPGGITTVTASTINWFGTGQSLANGVTLTLNATRQLTVICGGASNAETHFIINIAGYYL